LDFRSKRMAIVATMAVVRCNPKLLAATVDLSAPGAAAGVALAWYSSVGYFTGTNHALVENGPLAWTL
jgi:hypothetical protein